jgi:hypothetical protein
LIKDIVKQLRDLAQECTWQSRHTRQGSLSRALQELGVLLATKALELERRFDH